LISKQAKAIRISRQAPGFAMPVIILTTITPGNKL